MANQKSYPIRFTPRGLSDAFDATDTFAGACRTMQNLIFDQSNPEQIAARPGVGSPMTSFVTFTTPTFVSLQENVNGVIYGMVASALTAGYDQPFAFQIGVGFISISGVTSGNVPVSLSTTGDWIPPSLAVIGAKIVVTHAGFSGLGSNFFGVIDISNPAAPAWSAANTSTHALPSVPTFVANFNNRAYFVCKNLAYYSDVLVPTTMTNAGQSLTVGDTSPILALSGLPVQTTSAGVVAALIVFKQFQIWQITGDAAITGSLAQNFLSLNIGCMSPRKIVQTPIGPVLIGIDGAYLVSALGQVMPLTKDYAKLVQDVQTPFQAIVNPTRAAAAFTGGIYRVCLDTTVNGQQVTNDYWFDIVTRRWTGPHTFAYDCASPAGNYFVLSHRAYGAALFNSPYLPTVTSNYNDNGVSITAILESSLFPKTQNINMKQVVESTIELSSLAQSISYTINALDEQHNQIGTAQANLVMNVPRWGAGAWGSGLLWTASNNVPATYTVAWSAPLVFKKMAIQIIASANFYLSIGTFFAKYQDCGYTNK